jgi:hypothetical protein
VHSKGRLLLPRSAAAGSSRISLVFRPNQSGSWHRKHLRPGRNKLPLASCPLAYCLYCLLHIAYCLLPVVCCLCSPCTGASASGARARSGQCRSPCTASGAAASGAGARSSPCRSPCTGPPSARAGTVFYFMGRSFSQPHARGKQGASGSAAGCGPFGGAPPPPQPGKKCRLLTACWASGGLRRSQLAALAPS